MVRGQEERPGIERIAAIVLEERSVGLMGAALGPHGDISAPGEPAVGIETAGGDIHRLDGFERRIQGCDIRQPHIHEFRTVDAEVAKS